MCDDFTVTGKDSLLDCAERIGTLVLFVTAIIYCTRNRRTIGANLVLIIFLTNKGVRRKLDRHSLHCKTNKLSPRERDLGTLCATLEG